MQACSIAIIIIEVNLQILMSVLKAIMNVIMCASTQWEVSYATVLGLAINFKAMP